MAARAAEAPKTSPIEGCSQGPAEPWPPTASDAYRVPPHRRVHVCLDLNRRQCPVVDAEIVDPAVEVEAAPAWTPADIHVRGRVLLARGDRADQRAVVQLTVQIHMQRRGPSVID